MMRTGILLPLTLLLLSLGTCFYGLAGGSLLSLPYPDPPPTDVLAAARAREHVNDMIALAGAVAFILSLIWIVTHYRGNRTP